MPTRYTVHMYLTVHTCTCSNEQCTVNMGFQLVHIENALQLGLRNGQWLFENGH